MRTPKVSTSGRKKNRPDVRASLTNPQRTIYQAGWKPGARHRTAVCGRRFGKTFLMAEEIRRAVKEAVRQKISPENEIWYGAPTQRQAKRVMWPRIKRVIPDKWVAGKPNETEMTITLKTGHVIRLVGLEDADNLRGSGLWFFGGDEWADCDPAAWIEVIRPMLSTSEGHTLFIGTPKGYDHFREAYHAGQPGPEHKEGWTSFLFTTFDGGNVKQSEIDEAVRIMDPRSFRQEYQATFETFSGRVVYAFSRTESVKPCPHDPALPLHIGMDFNVNPMTATVWQEEGQITRQIGEIELPSSNTDEMAAEIIRRYGRKVANFDGTSEVTVKHITVYPDPAGAAKRSSAQGRTDIGILASYGFNLVAMSSAPLVRDRINVTNARFENAAHERRAFVDPACLRSIKCYEQLSYKEGTSSPDKDGGFDHLVDATGYYLFGRYAYKPAGMGRSEHMGR